jgi:hypothetical protein
LPEPDPRFPPETYCIFRLPRARWVKGGAA